MNINIGNHYSSIECEGVSKMADILLGIRLTKVIKINILLLILTLALYIIFHEIGIIMIGVAIMLFVVTLLSKSYSDRKSVV